MSNFDKNYNIKEEIMQTILFRTDSSSAIGTGHIMRDLVLAKQYPGSKIIFATQDLKGNINHKIIEAGYQIEILKSHSIDELDILIKKLQIDMIVIDHYGIDYEYEKKLKIKNSTLKILSFDDTYEKHYCDILLNHNLSADGSRYKGLVPKHCELRCGAKCTLLRDEFHQNFPERIKTKDKNILVAMGGVDSRELNIKIVEVLCSFENVQIDVITTTANKNLDVLKKYVANLNNVTLYVNTSEVAKLMHESDFAIVTPSTIVNEAYFMKLPFIAIKTEDNQIDIGEYFKRNNFSVLDKFDTMQLHKKVKFMIDKTSSKLINFTKLTLDEKKMILEWRNSDAIKKWMHNRDTISLESHLEFIDLLNSRDDRIYFLVKNENNFFGVVDLTKIKKEKSAEFGIYANPKLKGYGSLLMNQIIEYAFDELNLKKLNSNVYENNLKAIYLYKKFNFKIVGIIQDKNGKLLNMELISENR